RLVPVAIDQAYQRRQKDSEGEFYRRIAAQSPRHDFDSTTQGFYVATAAGELLLYNNNRDPAKVERLVRDALARFAQRAPGGQETAPLEVGEVDRRWHPKVPEGGFALRVHGKVLGGYPAPEDDWQRILQTAISRDNLWVTGAEHRALVRGELPQSLLRRIARFHLVDGTRGEPPMWKPEEVQRIEIVRQGDRLQGEVVLQTEDGARRFAAQVLGFVEVIEGKVTRFDLVARGLFRGEGTYTKNGPPGDFPFAVSLTLADGSDVADAIPPQGSRGWIEGYLR
ncbi:MAG: hypothetical protein KDC48_20265, partial [Planctomycetes bacterium]|nr:hypothetical protein [Planctomycetota bacterium]